MEILSTLANSQSFLIAFFICLISYIFHTVSHFLEYKGRRFVDTKHLLEITIFVGYGAWFFMMLSDPVRMDLSEGITTPFGAFFGIVGFFLFFLALEQKEGFWGIDKLITSEIYSQIRHPMYLGIIFIHIGFPILTKSLLTFISAVIWIPLVLLWKYWEERDLIKKFPKEYDGYKKKTLF